MFTTNEVKELAGCTPKNLRRFAELGIVRPLVNNGPGRGKQCKYSFSQTVALVYATQLAEEGWKPPAFGKILQDLSEMPDHELHELVANDCTLPIAPGVWISPSDQNLEREDLALVRRVDVTRPYGKVMNHITNVMRDAVKKHVASH